jgi:hypothetical protein
VEIDYERYRDCGIMKLQMMVLNDENKGIFKAHHLPHAYNFACPHANNRPISFI